MVNEASRKRMRACFCPGCGDAAKQSRKYVRGTGTSGLSFHMEMRIIVLCLRALMHQKEEPMPFISSKRPDFVSRDGRAKRRL